MRAPLSSRFNQEGASSCDERFAGREGGWCAICSRKADHEPKGGAIPGFPGIEPAYGDAEAGWSGVGATRAPQLLQNRASSLGRVLPQCVQSFATKPLLLVKHYFSSSSASRSAAASIGCWFLTISTSFLRPLGLPIMRTPTSLLSRKNSFR